MKIMLDTNMLISAMVFRVVRDEKDIPVLSDALYHDVDVLLTGDKDFLDSEISKPLIMSPRMFLDYMEFSGKI